MLRKIAILSLLLAVAACGAGAWLANARATAAFVAPGAANVQVSQIGPGERLITYFMPNPGDVWQTPLVRRLISNGWYLETDRYQWGGTETIRTLASYVRTSQFWFLTIRERVELYGDRSSAQIRVTYSVTTHPLSE